MVDGQVVIGHVFNGLVSDGDYGLYVQDGVGSFDEVSVISNDPIYLNSASNLLAAEAPQSPVDANEVLTMAELTPLVTEAIDRLRAGLQLDVEEEALLNSATFEIVDLEGLKLGETEFGAVQIDSDAAGHGWHTDPDAAVTAGQIDLISVQRHRQYPWSAG